MLAGKRLGSAGSGQGSGQSARARVPAPATPQSCGVDHSAAPPPRRPEPLASPETGAFQSYPGPGARRPRKEKRHT